MKRLNALLVLVLAALWASGCGSSEATVGPAPGGGAGTVIVNHTLLRGVPEPIDEFRITGFDRDGQVVFGPVRIPKQASVRLDGVSTSVVRLKIEYLDGETVAAVHEADVLIVAGGTVVLEDPLLALQQAYTTLDVTIEPLAPSDKGYVKLTHGPGWDQVVRTDLGATAQPGRQERRTPLASIAQISDVHVVDAESPLRVEYLRGEKGNDIVKQQDFQGAFRAQEMLTTHVAESMMQQLNDLGKGPVTGRPFDFLISTGDNGDNRQANELSWFMTLLDGGAIQPSSGDPNKYEGVQDQTTNPHFNTYYHPDAMVADIYKQVYGFPDYPGLLDASVKPFQAEGSRFPWYTVYGNHDNLVLGNLPTRANQTPTRALDGIVTGTQKNLSMPPFYTGNVLGFLTDFFDLFGFWPQFIARSELDRMISSSTAHRIVTADATRRFLDPAEWAQAHFNSPAVPGPVGHGLDPTSVSTGQLYYAFAVSPGVVGITLDTVNRAGYADGSLDQPQFNWLLTQLQAHSSKYYDTNGNLIQTGNTDSLIVLFSHHNSQTLENPLVENNNDPPRVLGKDLIAALQRFPNVVLWVNGHSHVCRVWAHPDSSGRTGGFWEINTPSHVDFPQQSRIIELVNNQDGTLSFFATLVDHQAIPETDPGNLTLTGLASISRELSANDNFISRSVQLGSLTDRNVELLIEAPF